MLGWGVHLVDFLQMTHGRLGCHWPVSVPHLTDQCLFPISQASVCFPSHLFPIHLFPISQDSVCSHLIRFPISQAKHIAEANGEEAVDDEKRNKCDQCGATFNRPCKLKRHVLLHSGERPFPCHVCTASFTQVYHLRAHMQRHAGEKPHR